MDLVRPAASTCRSSSSSATTPASGSGCSKTALLSPERRVQRLLQAERKGTRSVMSAPRPPFDPYAILTALERRRVTYVVIGGFARVVQGTDELTHGVDLAPSMRAENLRRLALALGDLDADRVDGQAARARRDDDPASSQCSSSAARRASSRSFPSRPARAAATTISAAPRRASRSARASAPGRLDRRPRAHARRPRPRTRHADAPTASGTSANSNSGLSHGLNADPPERRLQPSAYRNYQRR